MRYYLLLVLVTCATYAAVSVLAAFAISAAWPRIHRRARTAVSSARARAVAAARLAPVTAGSVVAAILSNVFLRYEPRDTAEDPGVLLMIASAVTMALVVTAGARLARAVRAGAECSRLLRAAGRPAQRSDGTPVWIVDSEYPVAAVTGIFRTRLLLSTRIIDECTTKELDAVVRHETAHVMRRDNVVRAAMLYLPDPLGLLRAGREMTKVWAAAAEESADDAAAGHDVEDRTILAAALVRVARMASTPAPRWVPVLAFYEGTNLESRVRRLLDHGRAAHAVRSHAAIVLLVAVAVCTVILTDTLARQVHAWMELSVRLLP
ncbi:MAG: M48 family metalloprotease [Acidobacteria bacterium]|nr:M48 family metalloprotease [Acidobacteriota bacterium]